MRTGLFLMLALTPCMLEAQRKVEGNTIVSATLPAATLEVSSDMEYAGTQTFELYGVATAEQHFFVEREGPRIRRFLWIQYEGYHPSNTHTYNYRDSTVTHSGKAWHHRVAAIKAPETEARPDSDGARMRAFLRAKGWTMGPELLMTRMVWMVDTTRRNELMVIYMEDLAGQGLTAADLNDGGGARDKWPAVAAAFHARALASFSVRP